MKKILIGLSTVVIVLASIPLFAAFEAHVINVTAHIENAVKVIPPDNITFGTVFPQEHKEKRFWITTSDSFCDKNQKRVTSIDYKIVQKPKPIWPKPAECSQTYEDVEMARLYCHDNPDDLDCCYPSLCPYLSKTPVSSDPSPYTDYGVPAFHNPADLASIAKGTINKYYDIQDEWIIDLAVPCFRGMCDQDYPDFVALHNPDADPNDYKLSPDMESKDFGCDLWIEVTKLY